MDIEEKLRGALDVPAPLPTTTLDHVLKRGRRRVFAQRIGATLGVFVVVAGVGLGAATLNQAAPPPTPAEQLTEPPVPATVEHAQEWQQVNAPEQPATGNWTPDPKSPPPFGWRIVDAPLCEFKPPMRTRQADIGTEPMSAEFVAKFVEQARKRVPEVTFSVPKTNQSRTDYEIDVTESGATGSIAIQAGRLIGPPLANADDALWETGDCIPAKRLVRSDGTVLQLHSVRPFEPWQTLKQVLTVWRADGLLIKLELRNFGGPDYTPNTVDPNGSSARTKPGRETLQLTDEQFSRLGPAIAEVA